VGSGGALFLRLTIALLGKKERKGERDEVRSNRAFCFVSKGKGNRGKKGKIKCMLVRWFLSGEIEKGRTKEYRDA